MLTRYLTSVITLQPICHSQNIVSITKINNDHFPIAWYGGQNTFFVCYYSCSHSTFASKFYKKLTFTR